MAKATKNSYKPAKRIGNYKPVKMAEGGNVSELGYSERREYIEENYAPFITDAQMIFSIWDSGIEYDYKADRKEVVNKIIEEYKNLGDYTEATLPQETIYEIQDWDLVRREIDPETDEVIGETPLKEVSADNTYNFSYKGLVDLNWRVYHDEDYDRFFYVITPHLGGDIRGNYGDAIILEGNDRDDLFYRFYEGFISGGASIYFKFKDGSEIGFDSEQDSDVFYFRVNEIYEPTGMAQKYLNDFEKFESWQGDEFLEETIDIYLARKGVAPKMMAGGSLNDETPKAYIQILGYDEGKWLTITDYSDGQDVIDAIGDWMNDLNQKLGGNREEFEVADYEGFGDDLYDQYMSSNEFDEIIEAYEKYESSDFPADVISAYKKDSGSRNDSLSDVIDEMDNNYFGKYDNLNDFGYEMVEQGVYQPSENDVFITHTDKRILAGEESDSLVDEMSFENLMNVAPDTKSEYEDEKSELEDKILEIQSEIDDLTYLQTSADDDDEYETIASQIEEKEVELDDVQSDLDDIDNRFEDKAREEARESFYDEIHDRLENDLEGWLSDYGYDTDNLADVSFISVDYEKIGNELSSDYLIVEFDGEMYFFNNYAKGGRIMASKRKPKYDFYIVENSTKKLVSGYSSKAEAIEQRKLLIQQYPSMRFEIYPLANLEAKTDLDVYAKKDYVELSTLDKIKKVSVDAYRYGQDKVGQAQMFLEKNDVKGKIKRGARKVADKTKQGASWLQKQWREADFGDGKGKAKYFADGGNLYSHQIGKYVRAYYNETISNDDNGYQVNLMFYNNQDDDDYFDEEFITTNSPEEAEILADKINEEGVEKFMPKNKFADGGEAGDKKPYEITLEDVFSFATQTKVVELTDAQYKSVLEQKKNREIVIDRYNQKQGIHEQYRIKSVIKKFADGGGVDEVKYFYIKGRNEYAPQELKDTYAEFYTENDLIEYLNKWKGNKDVSFNSITKVYNNGESKDVTDFYLKNPYSKGKYADGGYPTKLNIGSIIQGVGFTMLKGLEGGKFYKIVDKDSYSATFIESDENGKIKKNKKLVRHYLSSLDGGISTVEKGNENGFLVVKYADGGGVDLKVTDLKKGDRLKKKGSNLEVDVLEVGNDWRSGYDYALIESPFGGKPSSYIDVSNFVMSDVNSKPKYPNDDDEVEQISEKDFVNRRSFKIGNILIELEKYEKPTYYKANYISLEDKEEIGSYGSPIIEDVIFDIKSEKNKMANGGGVHTMPNGEIMLNSAHYSNGGGVATQKARVIDYYINNADNEDLITLIGVRDFPNLIGVAEKWVNNRDTYYDKIFNAIDGIHNRTWGENKFVELGLEKFADGGEAENKVNYAIFSGDKKLSSVYLNDLGYTDKYVGRDDKDADNFGMKQVPAPRRLFVFRDNSWISFDSKENALKKIEYWKETIQKDDRYTDEIKKSLIKSAENLKKNIFPIKYADGGMAGLGEVSGMLPNPLPMSTITPMANGGRVEAEINNLDNRIHNLEELVVVVNEDEKAEMYATINTLKKEKENLIKKGNKTEEVKEKKSFFGLFAKGGEIKSPKDNSKVHFTDDQNREYDGRFIEDENMFFIGFEDKGGFRFKYQVIDWHYLDDKNDDDAHVKHEASETAEQEIAEHKSDDSHAKHEASETAEEEKAEHEYDVYDNKRMLENQAKEVEHHSEELNNQVEITERVPAWVIAKMERATTDLSDITHYLDGENKMANGGNVGEVKYEILPHINKFIVAKVTYKQQDDYTYPSKEFIYGFNDKVLEFNDMKSAQKFIDNIEPKYPYGIPKANVGMLLLASELLNKKQAQQPQQAQPQVVYYIPQPQPQEVQNTGIIQDIPEMANGGYLGNDDELKNDFCITNLIELANELQSVKYFVTDRFKENDIKSKNYKGRLIIVFKEPASVNVVNSINKFIERAEDCHHIFEQSVNVSGSEPNSLSINLLSDKFSDTEFNKGGKVYDYAPKKINLEKTKKITTHLGDYNLGLITNDFVYFVNVTEEDENAQTIMYNKKGELLSDNIHATNDFFQVLQNEDKFEFIHPDIEAYRQTILKEN